VLRVKERETKTAAADNYVRLFDGIKVRHLFKGHTGPVRALSKVLPDDESSKLFASASNDGFVEISRESLSLRTLIHGFFVEQHRSYMELLDW